ncbi:hypothetical protein [Leuconostoc citreum]|uniref:hypothetical protein n=1 Tax=Leuconostoc citreum TaxID=33964 RepID=UPI0032DFECB2
MTDNNFSKMINNYFKYDYRERGKIKWQGYFLSDHTAALKRDMASQNEIPVKLPQMTLNECQTVLRHGLSNYEYVTVQQNIQDKDGHLVPNVTGLVAGFGELGVSINSQYIAYENIRSVRKVS